jgi:hypothetical protein
MLVKGHRRRCSHPQGLTAVFHELILEPLWNLLQNRYHRSGEGDVKSIHNFKCLFWYSWVDATTDLLIHSERLAGGNTPVSRM